MATLKLTSHFAPVFPNTQWFTIFCSTRARSKDTQKFRTTKFMVFVKQDTLI